MTKKSYQSLVDDYDSLIWNIDTWKRDKLRDILFNKMGMFSVKKTDEQIENITDKEEQEISSILDDVIENLLEVK